MYNAWIDRSLARLAELVPGRYAKFEASSGLIASLDGYAYRAPGAQPPPASGTAAPATGPDAAPRAPTTASGGTPAEAEAPAEPVAEEPAEDPEKKDAE